MSGQTDVDALMTSYRELYATGRWTLEKFAREIERELRPIYGLSPANPETIRIDGETRGERIARLCREGIPIFRYPGRPEYDGLTLDRALSLV